MVGSATFLPRKTIFFGTRLRRVMAGGTQSIPVRRLGLSLTCERACAGTGILWERDWILRTGCIKKGNRTSARYCI